MNVHGMWTNCLGQGPVCDGDSFTEQDAGISHSSSSHSFDVISFKPHTRFSGISHVHLHLRPFLQLFSSQRGLKGFVVLVMSTKETLNL